MNINISRLSAIAQKPVRHIIGLMSGTSLDGLDIAWCRIAGSGRSTRAEVLRFATVAYPAAVKEEIRKVFARGKIDFSQLCLLHPWIGGLHAEYINNILAEWGVKNTDIDLIASHGQTVYHFPRILHRLDNFPDSTLQIGDGDHIAVKTGIITISDFRQKHIAAGGEGAPLALYGDYCIFSSEQENRVMLNMGGIANFTYLPRDGRAEGVFVTDTGPGNTLIDALAQHYFQQDFDRDAAFAMQGAVNGNLLAELKNDEFFLLGFPKTTGPELFNLNYLQRAQEKSHTQGLSPHDLIATATRFSADTIYTALREVVKDEAVTVYISGGGVHNPLLIHWISERLKGTRFVPTDELGIPGDAKEAVLFAILANEALAGAPINFHRQGMPAVTMGKISFPE